MSRGAKRMSQSSAGRWSKSSASGQTSSARPGNTATVAYDGRRFWQVEVPHMNAFYPGTGDVFASVLVGALLQGDSLPLAVERAVRFVTRGISVTLTQNTVNTEGILLEQVLSTLGDREGLGQFTEF